MKKTIISILLLLGYCVPYAFLSMYGDIAYDTMLLYGLMAVCFAIFCALANKIKYSTIIVIIGNILSGISSYLFMLKYQTEDWSRYFKPLSATNLFVVISVIALILQLFVVWRLKRKM